MSSFMHELIHRLFVDNLLLPSMIIRWVNFMLSFLNNGSLKLRCKALQLLSAMLPPLAKLLSISQHSHDELKATLEDYFSKIIFAVENSFGFKDVGIECAQHVLMAIKNFPRYFFIKVYGIEIFDKILDEKNPALLKVGMTAFAELCHDNELHELLKQYIFFCHRPESFVKRTVRLFKQPKYRLEATLVLIGITQFRTEFLNDRQKKIIFNGIFNKLRNVASKVAELIVALKYDLLPKVISMIMDNGQQNIDLNFLVPALNLNPWQLLKFAFENSHDEELSKKATEMFVIASRVDKDHTQLIMESLLTLSKFENCEKAISILLDEFCDLDDDDLIDYLSDNGKMFGAVEEVCILFQASYDGSIMSKSAKVLYRFYSLSPQVTMQPIKNLVELNLDNFDRNTENSESFDQNIVATSKLLMLLKCSEWNLLSDENLLRIYHATLDFANRDLHQMRLHSTVLKQIVQKIKNFEGNIVDNAILSENVMKFKSGKIKFLNFIKF